MGVRRSGGWNVAQATTETGRLGFIIGGESSTAVESARKLVSGQEVWGCSRTGLGKRYEAYRLFRRRHRV